MRILYEIAIRFYRLSIILASAFNPKARGWVKGRQRIFSQLSGGLRDENDKLAWFHCASLGEFEQGRPIIENFRKQYPGYKILLTFFSPSGYEIRKNYSGADYIFYLPADTRINVLRFYQIVKPDVLFLVKYEYWFNYIDILHRNNIPIYVISGIFRKTQHFFRWYGAWFRKHLRKVSYFFVQDDISSDLLHRIGIHDVVVSGDTRFDRVADIAAKSSVPENVQLFCKGYRTLVCGSTWPQDEAFLRAALDKLPSDAKVIIAPHEVDPGHTHKILDLFGSDAVLYSEFGSKSMNYRVLVIDCIGMLSSLYRCAYASYVGGGFGKSIHNILEASAYGIPVIFGPENKKFPEAGGLRQAGGGFEICNADQLNRTLWSLFNNNSEYSSACNAAKTYMQQNTGATEKICSHLNLKV